MLTARYIVPFRNLPVDYDLSWEEAVYRAAPHGPPNPEVVAADWANMTVGSKGVFKEDVVLVNFQQEIKDIKEIFQFTEHRRLKGINSRIFLALPPRCFDLRDRHGDLEINWLSEKPEKYLSIKWSPYVEGRHVGHQVRVGPFPCFSSLVWFAFGEQPMGLSI